MTDENSGRAPRTAVRGSLLAAGLVTALAVLAVAAPAAWAQDGPWRCARGPTGDVCVRFIAGETGVDVKYTHTADTTIQARFAYRDKKGRLNRDDGAFTMSRGETRSFAWNDMPTASSHVVGSVDINWAWRSCVSSAGWDVDMLPGCGRHPCREPSLLFRFPPGCISWELIDAWDYPAPSGPPPGLTDGERQVMSWLQKHQPEILRQESKRRIDRRAIAAAIAWEALENQRSRIPTRPRGPGKVHFDAAVVEDVESRGYVDKRRNANQRERDLTRPRIAIDYIGAVMQAYADVTAKAQFPDVRCNIAFLTHVYQGPGGDGGLDDWEQRLRAKQDKTLKLGNRMAGWAASHIPYLTAAVGAPDNSVCSGSPGGSPGIPGCPDGGYLGTPGQRVQLPNSSAIYVVDPAGYRRWIPDMDAYLRLFRDWQGVVVGPDARCILAGEPLPTDVRLVRADGDPGIYLVDRTGGWTHKRWIVTEPIFDTYHFSWRTAQTISLSALRSIPSGPNWG